MNDEGPRGKDSRTSHWRKRVISGDRVGVEQVPGWLADSYRVFRGQVMDDAYPCFFGTRAEQRGEMFYAFVLGQDLSDLPATMRKFAELAALLEFERNNIAIFFEPDPKPLEHSQYHELFWRTLGHLQEHDASEGEGYDPSHPLWEFSFAGVEMFVVCACPSFGARHSRNLGPGMVLLFQPRSVFVDKITNRVISQQARAEVRRRLTEWDELPAHPDLGLYGDPDNREWKQYFLPDDNQPVAGGCPVAALRRSAHARPITVLNDARASAIESAVEGEIALAAPGGVTAFDVVLGERPGIGLAVLLPAEVVGLIQPDAFAFAVASAVERSSGQAPAVVALLRSAEWAEGLESRERRAAGHGAWRDGQLAALALYEGGRRVERVRARDPEPPGETEAQLASIWREVLRRPELSRDASFFALGGSSLDAARVAVRVQARFHVTLEPSVWVEAPSLRALARHIEAAKRSTAEPHSAVIRPIPRMGPLAVSPAQARMWLSWRLDPESAAYNIVAALSLSGELQHAALQVSLEGLVQRHEVLRTVFEEIDGVPHQRVSAACGVVIAIDDLSAQSPEDAQRDARTLAESEAARPFDLESGPLLRVRLLRQRADLHLLVLCVHHSVCDGVSMSLLLGELVESYAAQRLGRPAALDPLPIQYADYAVWQRERLSGAAAAEHLAYFERRLAGQPPLLDLGCDASVAARRSGRGASLRFELEPELVRELRAFASRHAVTPFSLLFGAFQLLLFRRSSERDSWVGVPVALRTRLETERLIGLFVNTLVIRNRIDETAGFAALVKSAQQAVLEARAHQELPLERVVEALQPERTAGQNPLFQVLYNHERRDLAVLRALPGLQAEVVALDPGIAKFDLSLNTEEDAESGRIWATFLYATELFQRSTIERMREHFETLLGSALRDPERPIRLLELLSEGERRELAARRAAPRWAMPAALMPEAIEAQVRSRPDAVALVFEDQALSCGELDRRASRLALKLVQSGAGPDVVVGVRLERSLDLIVALLAIVKSGAAYLPLDVELPETRQAFMLEDSGARLLISAARCEPGTGSASLAHVYLDARELGAGEALREPPALHPENLAYVLYTSGTTGRPKAVGNTHGALRDRLAWMRQEYGFSDADRLLQKTPASFDVSVWEIFLSLLSGARLALAAPGDHREPERLAELIQRHEVTTVHFAPSVLREFVALDAAARCTSLVRVFSGGEALPVALCGEVLARFPGVRFDNRYGPTEALINVSYWTCRHDDAARATVPIGQPIPNSTLQVLDAALQPVPAGVSGELWIAGSGLARGYVGKPGLTAERFVPNPCGVGERMYRSGDWARLEAGGALEFLGRKDRQVKLRGVRIELEEIEARLQALAGVDAAALRLFTRPDGAACLVAYVAGAAPLEPRALLDGLALELPRSVLPAQVVQLDRLPRLASGKLDRSALPEPAWQARGSEPPRGALERRVAAIWEEVLEVEQLGRDADFFELGGHSLLAARVVARVRRAFDLELSLRSLFEAPRLGLFAGRVQQALDAGRRSKEPALEAIERRSPPPLSYSQERMWFLWQLAPESAAYNVSGGVRLWGRLDRAALGAALQALVDRHEALRTSFPRLDSGPVQDIAEQLSVSIEDEDLGSLSADQAADELARRGAAEAHRPFDLERGPLLRVRLLRLQPEEHALFVTLPHIVAEGWTMDVFAREYAELYAAFAQGLPSPLQPLPVQYADYSAWQRRWLESGEELRQLAFWKQTLGVGGHPVLQLPSDRPRPVQQSFNGDFYRTELDPALGVRLAEFNARTGSTLFASAMAALYVLLYRITGQRDLRVGYPVANRARPELEGLIGAFLNTQVLRCRLSGELTVRELLRLVQDAALDAREHQDVPFHRVVEAVEVERSAAHTPLFQVMCNVQRWAFQQTQRAGDLELEFFANDSRTARFDLALNVSEVDRRVEVSWTFNTDLFDRETVERWALAWSSLLAQMLAAPSRRLCELQLLSDEEQERELYQANDAYSGYQESACLQERIEHQASAAPDATALVFEGHFVSYAELWRRAAALGEQFIQAGVAPDELVGILVDRSIEMMVGMVGILAAGAGYLPLDPEHPSERLRFMLTDGGVRVVLTERRRAGLLAGLPVLAYCLDDAAAELPGASEARRVRARVHADNVAYCIYTSGSTGTPKGTSITHHGLVHRLEWMRREYGVGASETLLQKTPLTFDVSVWELFLPLLCGARLIIASPGDHRDPERLAALVEQHQISVIHFVPSMLGQFLSHPDIGECRSVRRVFSGGEALTLDLQSRLLERLPGVALHNRYGPTETVIFVSHWNCRDEGQSAIPIGFPIADTALYILDADLNLLPSGAIGEIYIGGVGLARGYLRRAGWTAERFIPDPFAPDSASGGRLYRSGDLGRRRSDGAIEYHGRIDDQVKVRGFRIELREIEAQLRRHQLVSDAVVVVRQAPGGKRLVGYVVAVGVEESLPELLKAALRAALPEYMVPSQLLVVPEIPVTTNGKLNHQALPEPNWDGREHVPPQSAAERLLVEIWQELLGAPAVGVNDNFFELGGDSILSLQVVSRARAAGLVLSPKDVLVHQDIRSLARVARQAAGGRVERELVTGSAELTPIQSEFFSGSRLDPQHYNQSVLLVPREPLDPGCLARALDLLLEHHDALRARFERGAGTPWVQHFAAPVAKQGAEASVLWWKTSVQPGELAVLLAEAQRSLDLERGPLLRALGAKLSDGSERLLLVVHHLVVDAVSWRVLLEDLELAYRQLQRGAAVSLPAKTASFQAWSALLARHASSPVLQAQLDYWLGMLEAADGAELPCDDRAGSLSLQHAAAHRLRFTREQTTELLKVAPLGYRTRGDELLLVALSRALCRFSGARSARIRLEAHGRESLSGELDLSRTVGWCTSAFPVALTPDLGGDAGLAASIKRIKEQLRGVPEHGVGYGLLAHGSGGSALGRRLLELAPARVTFNYLGQFDQSFGPGSLFLIAEEDAGPRRSERGQLGNWLTIDGQVYGGELVLDWKYSSAMYRAETIESLARSFAEELQAVVRHCSDGAVGGLTPSDFPLVQLSQRELDALPIDPRQVEDIYPLSPMQQGLLFHSVYSPGSSIYVNQMALGVSGLDVPQFRAAWQVAIDRHALLRTTFSWQAAGQQAFQIVHRKAEVVLRELDWRGQEVSAERLERLEESERAEVAQLGRPPLQRLLLVRVAEDRHRLIWTHHHLLMDGWSFARLIVEVVRCYGGERLEPLSARYRDYIEWVAGRDVRPSELFWQSQLGALDEPTRLAGATPPRRRGEGHAVLERQLRADQTERLKRFAQQERVTLNTLLQGAWSLLLWRYTGQASVAFGATVAGRPSELPGIETVIGLFINTLPVVQTPGASERVGPWLRELQARNLALREHEHTPLHELQRWAGQAGQALFDSILVFENYPVDEALEQRASQRLRFDSVETRERTHYPMTVLVQPGQRLRLRFLYDRAHFDEQQVERIAGRVELLLSELSESAARTLGSLALATPEEQAALQGQEGPALSERDDITLHRWIERQVEATPDRVAVVFETASLSYRELDARANQLARHLRSLGIGPDCLVGLCIERSLAMVIGLLGILKAGGAYVPLDPELPGERLDFMIRDSGVSLIVTQSALLGRLPQGAPPACCLDGHWQVLPEPARGAFEGGADPANLAYCIYTSGSTGRPKGVGNSHRGIVQRLRWMQEEYALDASDSMLQKTPFSFDVSVSEFFWPLMVGAVLVMAAPSAHKDPQELAEVIRRHRVTSIDFVPSMLRAFAASGELESCDSLRRIISAGEALSRDLVREVTTRHPLALHNLYGPTEAAVYVTYWQCYAEGGDGGAPIGLPMGDTSAYVVDSSLGLLPAGLAGELCIGGIGVARGYHRRPSLTAERFVPDPFGATPGARLYRTGDLARRRADGVIDYEGRLDHQVKVRGFRIELGEIEARLLEHDQVLRAVVVARDTPNGKQLVGYVVLAGDAPELAAELREYLRDKLPEYMLPAQIVRLAELPLLPSGKLDRKALPEPVWTSAEEYVKARTDAERALVEIWRAVLHLERVGIRDNFFDLGGDSIVSLQVVARAREDGWQITPKDLFQHQTIEALVRNVSREEAAEQSEPEAGAVPLSAAQARLLSELAQLPRAGAAQLPVLSVRARETLDEQRLAQVFDQVLERHDALRLRFEPAPDGGWSQRLAARESAPGRSPAEGHLWLRTAATRAELVGWIEEARGSLSSASGPLLRAVLVSAPSGGQTLLLAFHPLALDEASVRLVLFEVQTAYRALTLGGALALPKKTASFASWAQRLAQWLGGAQSERRHGSSAADLVWPTGEATAPAAAARATLTLAGDRTAALFEQGWLAYRMDPDEIVLAALARAAWAERGLAALRIERSRDARQAEFERLDVGRSLGCYTGLSSIRLERGSAGGSAELAASLTRFKEALRAVDPRGPQVDLGAEAESVRFRDLWRLDRLLQGVDLFDGPELHVERAVSFEGIEVSGCVSADALQLTVVCPTHAEAWACALEGQLLQLCEHFQSADAGALSPSDFGSGLSAAQLERVTLPPRQIADIYAQSPMQHGMLFHSLLGQASGVYINQLSLGVEGLDVERFEQVWRDTIRSHDILRTGFVGLGDAEGPLQVVHRTAHVPLEQLDLSGGVTTPDQLEEIAASERVRAFDLQRPPLVRLLLLKLGPTRHQLIWTHHHALMDGWSRAQLVQELMQRYMNGDQRPTSRRYRDYIDWLERQDGAPLEGFWRAQLAHLDEPTLLSEVLAAPQAQSGRDTLVRQWSAAQTQRLQRFAQRERVTLNTVIQAAWLLLLQRYTGQRSVAFGVTVAGRPSTLPGAKEMLGLFINTLPVIQSPRASQRLGAWLRELQDHNLALREYEQTPLERLQRWSAQPGRALFDSVLLFQNFPADAKILQAGAERGLRFDRVSAFGPSHYPITLVIDPAEALRFRFNFDCQRFDVGQVQTLQEQLGELLEEMQHSPESALGALSVLPAAERARLLTRWSRSEAESSLPVVPARAARAGEGGEPGFRDWLLDWQAAAQAYPDKIAASCQGEAISYEELARQVRSIAGAVRAQGVSDESAVAILAERSLSFLALVLGVLSAGGVYVPLDPRHPAPRVAEILRSSGARLVIAGPGSEAQLAAGLARIAEAEWPAVALWADVAGYLEPPGEPAPPRQKQSLAYVIYTSGSTGTPKGAMVEHGGMQNHLSSKVAWLGLGEGDVLAQTASPAFDISIWQLLSPLSLGGRVEIVPDEIAHDPSRLLRHVEATGVSVLELVPSTLQAVLDAPAVELSGLRILMTTGEAIAPELVRRWFGRYAHIPIDNAYGPTECSDDVAMHRLREALPSSSHRVPIGRPIQNTQLYVVDRQMNLAPAGAMGELCVGGFGVGRGYVAYPAGTARAFVPNPFSDAGDRLYRTGDLVRFLPDGVIEYLDRIDHQVKVHGHRIELGEVEARLRACAGVDDAVVVARGLGHKKQLVGYVVARSGAQLSTAGLRAELRTTLPDYMLPAHVRVLARFPLTANGKLDRRALPEPEASDRQHVEPRTPAERALVGVWLEVLGVPRVSVTDGFFELGGDSILSLRVVALARAAGFILEVRDIFQHDTLEAIARAARASASAEPGGEGLVLATTALQSRLLERERTGDGVWQLYLPAQRPLDLQLLEAALGAVMARHDALRMVYARAADGAWQGTLVARSSGGAGLVWARTMRGESEVAELASALRGSLALEPASTLRAAAIRYTGGGQALLLVGRLAAVDLASARIVTDDLAAAYMQLEAGAPVSLPVPTASFVGWMRATRGPEGAALRAEREYWRAVLTEGMPERKSGEAATREDVTRRGDPHRHSVVLDAERTVRLRALALEAYRLDAGELVLVALARVLCRERGVASIVLEVAGSARQRPPAGFELGRTVGALSVVFAVCLRPELGMERAAIDAAIRVVKEQVRSAAAHAGSYPELTEQAGDRLRSVVEAPIPLPEVSFEALESLHAAAGTAALFAPVSAVSEHSRLVGPGTPGALRVQSRLASGELVLSVEYSEQHDPGSSAALGAALLAELDALLEHCGAVGAGALTPSDVVGGALPQRELDALLEDLN